MFSTALPAAAGGVYFVKEGDTVKRVSRLFGVDAESLRRTNNLGAGGEVKPGDRLRIPDHPAQPAPRAEGARRPDPDAERVLEAICREEKVFHAVRKGDTLSSIARTYGVGLDELLRLSGLTRRSRLSIGQKVLVRRDGPRTHTVARGDTLYRIATRHGVTVDDLVRLNNVEGQRISPGQRLVLEPCDQSALSGSAPPPLPVAGRHDTPSLPPPEPPPGLSERVVGEATALLDIPYRFGGTSLRGIDCSGYTQRVYSSMDIKLPRTAREQFTVGSIVGPEDLTIGDLVFFRTYASYPSHVGIYIGDNRFIHASSMVRKVTIDSMDHSYYRKRFIGARRLLADEATAFAAAP